MATHSNFIQNKSVKDRYFKIITVIAYSSNTPSIPFPTTGLVDDDRQPALKATSLPLTTTVDGQEAIRIETCLE